MDAGFELSSDGVRHHAVLLHQGLACKGRGCNADPEMAFTRRVRAGVAMVLLAFVSHLQCAGRKGGLQFCLKLLANGPQ